MINLTYFILFSNQLVENLSNLDMMDHLEPRGASQN